MKKSKMKYPNLTQQQILYIDGTPNNEYPLRILKAYLENCNCRWATDSSGNCENELFKIMNEHCEQRAKILRKAINILEKKGAKNGLGKS
jgi:hypothetical protein